MSTMAISLPCYGFVSAQHDYPEIFQYLPTQHHKTSTENFDLKLYVRLEKRCPARKNIIVETFDIPQLLSSHYISCNEFFQNGHSLVRRNLLFHDTLTIEVLNDLTASIMSCAQEVYNTYHHLDGSGSVLPLAIGLVIELPTDLGIEEIADVIISEYRQEIKMVPASEEVIQSLNKIELSEGLDIDTQCCICLEDFHGIMEVSAMPCNHHIFHNNCIVQWLKTSHFCPLCRYRVATINPPF